MSFGFGFGLPSWQALSGGFTPASLFSAGEQGAWYDPSDYSTLFTDSAGTTPVTGVEQFVGLMLDKSKGAPTTLGAELVTNGDFGNGTTGWSAGGSTTLSVSSGVMRATGTTDGAFFGQQVLFAANTWYKLTFSSLSDGTSKAAQINLGTTLGSSNRYAGSIAFGTNRTIYYYSSAAETLWMWFYPGFFGTTNYILIDDVSCKVAFGNHATSTGTKRPKLAARYNLLTYTEDFSNAVWQKLQTGTGTAPTTTNNFATAPDGTTTAIRVQFSLGATPATAVSRIFHNANDGATVARTKTIWAKTNDNSTKTIYFQGPGSGNTILTVTSAWTLFTVADVSATAAVYAQIQFGLDGSLGTSTSADILVWHPDLRPTSQATGLIGPTYQRVVDAATYDTAGFLPYLVADGLEDAMNTGDIVPGTDKVQVFEAVRKLTSGTQQTVELSVNVSANNGSFSMPSDSGTGTWAFGNKGSATIALAESATNSYAAPITTVNTGIGDIAGDVTTLRVNGVQAATSAADLGSGNYLTYPLYLFARGGTGLYFNGWMYGLIIRFGPNLSTSQIEATESWVAGKAGVSL
jgi:hypothetical protein